MPPAFAQALPLLIPLVVLALIARRSLRGRKLRLERLWLVPTLLAIAAAVLVAEGPPLTWRGGALYIAALALGALAGWYRGRFTQILVDPDTHEITSKGTRAGLILIALVFLARYLLRFVFMPAEGGTLHISATRVTDALVLFAVGVTVVQRLEMGLRARKLLQEKRAAKEADGGGQGPST